MCQEKNSRIKRPFHDNTGAITGDTLTAGGQLGYAIVDASKLEGINSLDVTKTVHDVIDDLGIYLSSEKPIITAAANRKYLVVVELTAAPEYKVIVAGRSAVINVTKRNNAPTVANAIADKTVMTTGAAVTVDASSTFTDADNDTLTISATSGNTGIATVSGTNINIAPLSYGEATITVTADDGKGGIVTCSFNINIKELLIP